MTHVFRLKLDYVSLRDTHLILPHYVPSGEYELLLALTPSDGQGEESPLDKAASNLVNALKAESDVDFSDFRDEEPAH